MAVYLIHFEEPFQHAKHYVGFSKSLATISRRLEHHRCGSGSRLMRAVEEAHIEWHLTRVWTEGDQTFERRLKGHSAGRYCPCCSLHAMDESHWFSNPYIAPSIVFALPA